MYTCTKLFTNYPFAHRQPEHPGHCSKIHGHNWDFELTFIADELDECGFVVDFGSFGWLKTWLAEKFDHTLVLNQDDSKTATAVPSTLATVIFVPNCGAEGLARFVFDRVSETLEEAYPRAWKHRNLRLYSVRVYEDSKNSASFGGLDSPDDF